jgi:hypothetical protein
LDPSGTLPHQAGRARRPRALLPRCHQRLLPLLLLRAGFQWLRSGRRRRSATKMTMVAADLRPQARSAALPTVPPSPCRAGATTARRTCSLRLLVLVLVLAVVARRRLLAA